MMNSFFPLTWVLNLLYYLYILFFNLLKKGHIYKILFNKRLGRCLSFVSIPCVQIKFCFLLQDYIGLWQVQFTTQNSRA